MNDKVVMAEPTSAACLVGMELETNRRIQINERSQFHIISGFEISCFYYSSHRYCLYLSCICGSSWITI